MDTTLQLLPVKFEQVEIEYIKEGLVLRSKPYILYKLNNFDHLQDSLINDKIAHIKLSEAVDLQVSILYYQNEDSLLSFKVYLKGIKNKDYSPKRDLKTLFGSYKLKSFGSEPCILPKQRIDFLEPIKARAQMKGWREVLSVEDIRKLNFKIRDHIYKLYPHNDGIEMDIDSILYTDGTILRR